MAPPCLSALVGRPAAPGFARGPVVVLRAAVAARFAPAAIPAEKRRRCAPRSHAAVELASAGSGHRRGRGRASSASRSRCSRTTRSRLRAFAAIDCEGAAADRRLARGARRRDRRLSRPPRTRHFRARAADLADMRDRVLDELAGGASARRSPTCRAGHHRLRRRSAALALPGHRLEPAAPSLLAERQPDEPCRDAGPRRAACRWSSASRRMRSPAAQPARRSSTARAANSSSIRPRRRAPPSTRFRSLARNGRGRGGARRRLSPEACGHRRRHADRGACQRRRAGGARRRSTRRAATASAWCGRSSCSRGGALPDEETQFAVYRRLAEWAAGKPVTIRTLDAGGDKPIAGLTAARRDPIRSSACAASASP